MGFSFLSVMHNDIYTAFARFGFLDFVLLGDSRACYLRVTASELAYEEMTADVMDTGGIET